MQPTINDHQVQLSEKSNGIHHEKYLTRRTLLIGNLAHFLHDGFTDMLYVFFPVWQAQWSLSFTQIGLFKTLVSGSMGLFQIPSGLIAQRVGRIRVLLAGTAVTGLAVLLFGWVTQPWLLGLLLILSGVGSSVQHPISSALISDAYTEVKGRRRALSALNFTGDIGKLVFPAAAAFLISCFQWPTASRLLAACGFLLLLILALAAKGLGPTTISPAPENKPAAHKLLLGWKGYQAFWSLAAIGVIDGATRMAFLTFLPFLLQEKGAGVNTIGFALALIFAGGATGKLVCGILATRVGILRSVIITESLTALCISGMMVLSLGRALLLAPLLGLALNGTSSVLYGSVPELVPEKQRAQAFSVFYTAVLGSGAIVPSVYGLISDFMSLQWTVTIIALGALATLPLTLPLRGRFQ
ncbi:MFS transporter [Desulfitobacterium chlororespirans]|uniref:Major Facilitator Superfamily protein n=1 Tax=Desulfitobacterium chlororespirans DSM 11544 TaxID=1121395 RepID=A0A1M7SGT8_9FIRM|nr:MFS transporter [Desulfitobacterium chlororespirans]SHN57696.1 Major Facilitator Superfamily protein [Desulfitobacterium chlororespirans DSM 11544]